MCFSLNWTEPRDHLDLKLNDIYIFFILKSVSGKSFMRNEDIVLFFSLGNAITCNNP